MIRKIIKKITKKTQGEGEAVDGTRAVADSQEEGVDDSGRVGEIVPKPKRRRRRRRSRGPKQRPGAEEGKKELAPEEAKQPWSMDDFQVPPQEGKSRFHDLALDPRIMRAIAGLKFSYCTPIQALTLPGSLQGEDIIGRAQTGTGKSAAFLITIFARLLASPPKERRANGTPRALVIAPTRELVAQISKDAKELSRYCDLYTASVYGGLDYQKQWDELESRQIDLMVATPGRLLDYLRKRLVRLDQVEVLVLDEADRMLDMGFIPDVRRIIHHTPEKHKRQTMMFSATITSEVRHLAFQWCAKAKTIDIEPENVEVDTVEQIIYLTTGAEKYAILYNILKRDNPDRVMVFTNRKDEARRLTERLKRNSINCSMLSGDVPQKKRMSRLEGFRAGRIRVLVATDVAGRGIHIDGISHVVNYTLPYEPEDYVHRIGRTGRAGAQGISISFACEEGGFYLPDIEELLGHKLECRQPEEELLVEPPKGTLPKAKKGYKGAGSRGGNRGPRNRNRGRRGGSQRRR